MKVKTVILVHGFGLLGLEMIPLALRLRRKGYDVMRFTYSSWFSSIPEIATQLREFIESRAIQSAHLVGFSLGGLVIFELKRRHPQSCHGGRIVTIGTPHNGSAAAKRIMNLPLGKYLIGAALSSVCRDGVPAVPACSQSASIAGTRSCKFISGLLKITTPNDMILSVHEVFVPNMGNHLEEPLDHLTLAVSGRVANHVDMFLKSGRFEGR